MNNNRAAEGPEICPGPQKYGFFWLRVRPETRRLAEECGKQLPRDSAPNRSLLEKVTAYHALRAVRQRSTVFVADLFDHKEGRTVSKLIRHCTPSEYRVWLKCMTGTYPVQAYLKHIGKAQSPICLHCGEGVPESLTHFACVCRPSDVHPAQLLAAAMRKQQVYLPLQEALSFYSDQGWTIHVFPWVVSIRGMTDPSHVHALLKFLERLNRHWQAAVDRSPCLGQGGLFPP
jgi:hypothetical protein